MGKEFVAKLKEAVISIFPIIILLVILNFAAPSFSLDPQYNNAGPVFTNFMISVIPLVIGLALFNMGAEKAMGKIGELAGSSLTKKKSLILLVVIAVLLGTLITIAEPDLSVFSLRLFPSGPHYLLVVIAALGVGVMLAVAIIRVIMQKSIKVWLVIAYGLVFLLGCLADESFYSIVFDAGGATTSAVSSPFIISFGIGVAAVRGGKNSEDDSFGYAGLCSLGPLITVMIMAIFLGNNKEFILGNVNNQVIEIENELQQVTLFSDIPNFYYAKFIDSIKEVSISLAPIVAFFIIYCFIFKIQKRDLYSIIIGLIFTFIGLVIFLMGANAGFIPVAVILGQSFINIDLSLFLIFGFVIGNLIILAEPAVHVLADQVAEVTRGSIRKSTVFLALCIGTGISVFLNIIRIYFDIPILMIIGPIYIVSFILCFLVPDLYVAIAFDSTGVATGTLSSCFLLPLFIGFTNAYYGKTLTGDALAAKVLENGFGIIGMISTMPIISIELIGLIAKIKNKQAYKKALLRVKEFDDSQVIHLPG